MNHHREAYARSLADPAGYWAEVAEAIDWDRRWDRVLDDRRAPFTRWFRGGLMNTCHNALDRHVAAGRGGARALIYESPVTGVTETYTFAELRDAVARFAGGLRGLDVRRGDRVLIYMPMVPEAVIGMLACARIGAIHTVVFGGFAARELATRIDHTRPRVVLTASCGIERERTVDYGALLEDAVALARWRPERHVMLARPQLTPRMVTGRDRDWRELAAAEPAECVPLGATDPLYILHTSGTTGRPKGIVRDNGGHAVALAHSMRTLYGVATGDVFWAASDIGWVVGHSYTVYGPLLAGCATVLYEGKPVGTPDAGAFWRVVERHGVHAMFTAPTALRAIKREDPTGAGPARSRLGSLRTLFVAGEHCDTDTLLWARERLGIPVVNHWWQTETGWPICTNPAGALPVGPASVGVPAPGFDVRVLDDDGAETAHGETGHVVVRAPLPPGGALTLWDDDEGYRSAYFARFAGCYATGDTGYVEPGGGVCILGRSDDVMNVAGHRLSAGAMEEVVAAHPAVAECAVVGVPDPLKGVVPAAFVTLAAGAAPDRLADELIARVRATIGPVASLKTVVVVPRLPKTRSGKVLRGAMRELATGAEVFVPATIEAPEALDEIARALARAAGGR